MSEIIKLTIVCDNCHHHNKFKASGERIPIVGGRNVHILTLEEEKKERICEECGSEIK